MNMNSSFYALVWMSGLACLWLLWDWALRGLFLDIFRERLFEARFSLFRLGMEGKLDFDSDLHRQLETMICGLLRFGHRATFLSFIASKRHQEQASASKDYVNVPQQITLKIAGLEPSVQMEVTGVLAKMQHAILSYLAFTSLLFLTVAVAIAVLKRCGIYRPEKAQEISNVVEQAAYRAEVSRKRGGSGLELSAAAA